MISAFVWSEAGDKHRVCDAYYTEGWHKRRSKEENLEFLHTLYNKVKDLFPKLSFSNRALITDDSLPLLADILKLWCPQTSIDLRNTSVTDTGIRKYRYLFSPSCQLLLDGCYGITPLSKELDHKLNVSTSNCGFKPEMRMNDAGEFFNRTCYRTSEIYEKYGPHPETQQCTQSIEEDMPRQYAMPLVCKIEWHHEPQSYKVRSICRS